MKIEKISDKQIRCTLTKEDLANRQLKLSELAYGSEKAKALFQDMMRQAARDFGFEADNMPLMIEAIPISMDSVLLVITKVDDPEELDSRFSRFSPDSEETEDSSAPMLTDLLEQMEGADDILDLIHKISDSRKQAHKKTEETPAALPKEASGSASSDSEPEEPIELTRMYSFRSLDDVISCAGILKSMISTSNALYKDPASGEYYLILHKETTAARHFNKICNILSEYAVVCNYTPGMDAYFAEHFEIIVAEKALQQLAQLS